MSENYYSQNNEAESIDLGKIFRFLLMQSKLIILIVFSAFLVSYFIYKTSIKQYNIQSLLQYESINQNLFNPSTSFQMSSGNTSSDISNLATLYESRTNILQLIKDLNLNIDIMNLDDDETLDITIHSGENNFFSAHDLTFSFYEDNYSLLDADENLIQTSQYGDQINFENLKIIINQAEIKDYRPIKIKYRNPESMYNYIKSKIVITSSNSRNSFFTSDGLMTISYVTDDIELGIKIINYANNIFLNQRINDETEKSRKAIEFIDASILSLEDVFESSKIKLKEFQEKNKSIDVSLETQAIIQRIQGLEESLSSISFEITKANELYTKNNPIYTNLEKKKEIIEKQLQAVMSEIEMMPKEQQEYIDLYNDLEVSRSLFEELESRRLAFSIMEASTIGDIRIIDDAYLVSLISPKKSSVFLFTLFSFIVACIIAIIRGFNFLPITNPAEIIDNNIQLPIIGVIPQVKDIELSDDNIQLKTSVESLILNIESINDNHSDKNLITITSPSPFNGKSTISMKLAEGISRLGKKVLLVDNDLKRGKLGKSYDIKSISEKKFNSIDESNIENYIIFDNFYLIPRVTDLNNSFHFLYTKNYKEKIQFFKNYFDYVIFDTGPILSVADSSILIEQSDFNILVVRHGINRMNEIKQSIDNFKQINKNIDGILYNGYAKPRGYYGYYGVYGNYSYQYYANKYLDDVYNYEKES